MNSSLPAFKMSSPISPPPTSLDSVFEHEEVDEVFTSSLLDEQVEEEEEGMTGSQAFNLYITHFLSTWNVRTYEFAAIIFTAAAYPDTLFAASIRGIVNTIASICLSSTVGRWVDQSPNRLKTLLSTISLNRLAVIFASVLWFFIVDTSRPAPGKIIPISSSSLGFQNAPVVKGAIFTLILLLGILENLSASGNMLSMERDWVIAVASSTGQDYDLTHLNAVMRRIDLVCKLIAPILISVVVNATSVKIGVLVVGAMSTASWGVEIWCARRVWSLSSRLKRPRSITQDQEQNEPLLNPGASRSCSSKTANGFLTYVMDFKNYLSSLVCIPSLSLAFLHLSALTYSATFITYLLSVGFSLDLITIARAAGSVVEICSTVVTPVGVRVLSKAANHGTLGRGGIGEDESVVLLDEPEVEERETETGLERLGLWGVTFQLVNLTPVVLALWQLSPSQSTSLTSLVSRILALPSQPLLGFTLFFFLSISRLGLWVFDLTTQQLTQTMVPPPQRSSFTGVEYSFVSLFELAQYVVTIVLNRPEQFKWIALLSWAAVLVSTVAYAGWVWKMRGHLVHWERIKSCKCVTSRHRH